MSSNPERTTNNPESASFSLDFGSKGLDAIPKRRVISIKAKLMLVVVFVSLALTLTFSIYGQIREHTFYMDTVEDHLRATAYGATEILEPENDRPFYHKAQTKSSITKEQYEPVARDLEEFARKSKVAAIYALRVVDGRLYFIIDSDRPDFNDYWKVYNKAPPALLKAVQTGEFQFQKPYDDEYGSWVSFFLPLPKTGGSPLTIVCADVTAQEYKDHVFWSTLGRVLLGLGVFIVCMVIQIVIVSQIVRPLDHFCDFSTSLVKSDFKMTPEERTTMRAIAKYDDEVGKLALSLIRMASRLDQFIQELARTTAEKQKVESELAIARDMQLHMVPEALPPEQDNEGIHISAKLEPAKAVGGDLYDFFMLDPYHLFFQIGDVSDKGIHAALFMAMTKTLLKADVMKGQASLAETMITVNTFLAQNNASQMFVTLFAGILDLRNGTVEYVDAGHELPFVLRKSGQLEVIKKKSSFLPIAIDETIEYKSFTLQLDQGDCLLLYTDGVREGMDACGKPYSVKRMEECVTPVAADAPPEEVVKTLLHGLKEFVQDAPQSDDIAVLAIRYMSPRSQAFSASRRQVGLDTKQTVVTMQEVGGQK